MHLRFLANIAVGVLTFDSASASFFSLSDRQLAATNIPKRGGKATSSPHQWSKEFMLLWVALPYLPYLRWKLKSPYKTSIRAPTLGVALRNIGLAVIENPQASESQQC